MAETAVSSVTLRPATDDDSDVVSRLAQRAYSEHPAREPAEPAENGVAVRPPAPLTVVAEHEGRVVAVASANLRGQWFGGRRVLCARVGGVAVAVEARGLGVGRALMTELLARAHDAGAVTSVLFPSTQRFYRGLGYGVGGRRTVHALSTLELRALLPSRGCSLTLRRTGPDDARAVSGLVRRRAARGSALLDHSGADECTAENPADADSFVVEEQGAVVGWCALGRRSPSTRDAKYDLVVRDLVADTLQAERYLWGALVADHPSALRVEAVVPIGSLLERSDCRQQVVEDALWMMRLLDVGAALTGRGYPLHLRAELRLRVSDPTCPWNAGTWTLQVADGVGRVSTAPGVRPDAVMAVDDLAGLYAGHLDPDEARHQGRLGQADDRTVSLLRSLLAGPPARLAQTF